MAFIVLNDLDSFFGKFYLNIFVKTSLEAKEFYESKEFLILNFT